MPRSKRIPRYMRCVSWGEEVHYAEMYRRGNFHNGKAYEMRCRLGLFALRETKRVPTCMWCVAGVRRTGEF